MDVLDAWIAWAETWVGKPDGCIRPCTQETFNAGYKYGYEQALLDLNNES